MEMTTDMLAPDALFAPAAPAELSALALLTIKPEEYVAQAFAPFRAKLTALKAEADTIHFEDKKMFDAPHRYVNIGTTEGMTTAIKMRASFRDDVRLDVEKTKTARKAPILQIGRLIDSTYKEIVEEVAPYEGKFDAAIKAEEKRKADVKAAKERAEAERIGGIKAAIEAIRTLPARAVGKSSEDLRALLERVAAREITKEEFAEFDEEAKIALDVAGSELVAMFTAAQQAEQAAAAAEAARLTELARIEAQRVENARVAAENERVANEQAAVAKKLADQAAAQEAAARRQQEAAEENLRAAAAAHSREVERARAEQERVSAESKRQIEAQQAALAADRRQLEEEKAAQALAVELAAKRDAAHGEALLMDAQHNAERARLQAANDQMLADARSAAPLDDLADASLTDRADQLLADDLWPSNDELAEEIRDLFMSKWGMDDTQAAARMSRFDFSAALADLAGAAA